MAEESAMTTNGRLITFGDIFPLYTVGTFRYRLAPGIPPRPPYDQHMAQAAFNSFKNEAPSPPVEYGLCRDCQQLVFRTATRPKWIHREGGTSHDPGEVKPVHPALVNYAFTALFKITYTPASFWSTAFTVAENSLKQKLKENSEVLNKRLPLSERKALNSYGLCHCGHALFRLPSSTEWTHLSFDVSSKEDHRPDAVYVEIPDNLALSNIGQAVNDLLQGGKIEDEQAKHFEESVLAPMQTKQPDLQSIAADLGKLLKEKNAAYGNSFAKVGDFLKLLYPDGVQPHQYLQMLTMARMFDKLMRCATKKDAFGENPMLDLAGYGILDEWNARMEAWKKDNA